MWKKTAGLKGSKLGALQDLDTEPLYYSSNCIFIAVPTFTLTAVSSGLY